MIHVKLKYTKERIEPKAAVEVNFENVGGNPIDNTALKAALDEKVDTSAYTTDMSALEDKIQSEITRAKSAESANTLRIDNLFKIEKQTMYFNNQKN